MALWQRWVRAPQNLWLRRAVFQIHLWTGLAIGLYVVVLSLTGSIMVYRAELVRAVATPRPVFDEAAPRRSTEELRAAAQRLYPDYGVTFVSEVVTRRNPVVAIVLERDEERLERLFNPYTGEDLGAGTTEGEWIILWLVSLHDDLLLDRQGRFWNGIGSAFLTLLVLTGSIIWWPGVTRWRRSLAPKWKATWSRFSWDLHSALGFWCLLFVALWGVTGIYLSIPAPFIAANDYLFGVNEDFSETTGDILLRWMTTLHFGRWQNGWLQALWAIVGVVPALLFVTGAIMWWNRVVKKRLRQEA